MSNGSNPVRHPTAGHLWCPRRGRCSSAVVLAGALGPGLVLLRKRESSLDALVDVPCSSIFRSRVHLCTGPDRVYWCALGRLVDSWSVGMGA
jgi:hypothetical protein